MLVDAGGVNIEARLAAAEDDPGLDQQVLVVHVRRVCVMAEKEDQAVAPLEAARRLGPRVPPGLGPDRVVREAVEKLILRSVVERVRILIERAEYVALVF